MTAKEMSYFRQRLLTLKKQHGRHWKELENETLRPLGGEMAGGVSDVPVHPADLGTDNFDEELNLDLLESEIARIEEINDALERIQAGRFGRCENCGQEIPFERLKAIPYARYCLRCASRLQVNDP